MLTQSQIFPDKELLLSFGSAAKPISTQLKNRGFIYDEIVIRNIELDINALNRLRHNQYVTDAWVDKITFKILDDIKKHVVKMNP